MNKTPQLIKRGLLKHELINMETCENYKPFAGSSINK